MEFKDNQAIYLQIADLVGEKIVRGLIKPGDRVPSVRELAVELAVNPNTVVRTFEHLTDHSIIRNQRGVGYFAADDAVEKVKKMMRAEFFDKNMPELLKQMALLDISLDDLKPYLEQELAAH
jgi:GntR family transcriptional regulator